MTSPRDMRRWARVLEGMPVRAQERGTVAEVAAYLRMRASLIDAAARRGAESLPPEPETPPSPAVDPGPVSRSRVPY